MCFQRLARPFVHLGGEVRVGHGEQAAVDPRSHRCAVFERKRVTRQVIGLQGEDAGQRRLPHRQRLVRNAEDQVKVDAVTAAVEARRARPQHSQPYIVKRVQPVKEFQFGGVSRLDAKGQPVDAERPQALEIGQIHGSRIRFERDLTVGRQIK